MSNPKWPQQPNMPPQPGAPAQGGAQPIASTQAMEFTPQQLQNMMGAQASQQGAPFGQAPQGNPFGQPSQPAFGQAPQPAFGQAPQGNAFGQPSQPAFGQAPQGNAFGQPSQPAWGQPPQQQQPAWGQAPSQPAWGQPATGYAAPPVAAPTPASGRSALSMLGAGLLVVAGVGAKVALRTGGRAIVRGVSTSSTTGSTIRPMVPLGGGNRARATTPDQQLQDKIDPYVERCLNRFSRQVFDAENRYYDWVDRRKGPTGRERVVYGIYDVSGDPGECARAVVTAAALTPSVPALEAAGPRFSATLATIVPLIHQAHNYYANPALYRGDSMAQGTLLHPQLVAAFAAFTDAQRALSEAVSASQDQATDAFLARVRTDPTMVVEYHLKNDQRMARHLARALRGWDVRNGQVTGIDAATFVPAVNEYAQGVSGLSTSSIQYPPQAAAIGGLPQYQLRSATYLRQLQGLSMRLQTGERFSRSDLNLLRMRMGWTVQGSPEAVNRAYNELVQSYNALR